MLSKGRKKNTMLHFMDRNKVVRKKKEGGVFSWFSKNKGLYPITSLRAGTFTHFWMNIFSVISSFMNIQ